MPKTKPAARLSVTIPAAIEAAVDTYRQAYAINRSKAVAELLAAGIASKMSPRWLATLRKVRIMRKRGRQ